MKNLTRILTLSMFIISLFLILGCQVPQDKMDAMDKMDSQDAVNPEVQQIDQGLEDVDDFDSLLEEDNAEDFDELESYLE